MHVVSYSDARNSLKTVLDRVVNDHAPTIIHRRGAGGDVVMISEQSYSSMVETLHLLSSPANAAHLAESIAQYRAGEATRRELLKAD